MERVPHSINTVCNLPTCSVCSLLSQDDEELFVARQRLFAFCKKIWYGKAYTSKTRMDKWLAENGVRKKINEMNIYEIERTEALLRLITRGN